VRKKDKYLWRLNLVLNDMRISHLLWRVQCLGNIWVWSSWGGSLLATLNKGSGCRHLHTAQKEPSLFSWTTFEFGLSSAEKKAFFHPRQEERLQAPVHSAKRTSLFSWTTFEFGLSSAEKKAFFHPRQEERLQAPVHSAKRTSLSFLDNV